MLPALFGNDDFFGNFFFRKIKFKSQSESVLMSGLNLKDIYNAKLDPDFVTADIQFTT